MIKSQQVKTYSRVPGKQLKLFEAFKPVINNGLCDLISNDSLNSNSQQLTNGCQYYTIREKYGW